MGPGFLVSIAYIDPGNCKNTLFMIFFCNERKSISDMVYLWYSNDNWQSRRIFSLGHNINMRCHDIFLWYSILPSSLFNLCFFFSFFPVTLDHIVGIMCCSCNSINGSQSWGGHWYLIWQSNFFLPNKFYYVSGKFNFLFWIPSIYFAACRKTLSRAL